MGESRELRSMAGMLRASAADRGDAEAFVFIGENATGETRNTLSYRALLVEADRVAEVLTAAAGADVRGHRVVLAVSRLQDFVVALFAIWNAGGIPVPAPAMGRTRVGRERLTHILADSEPVLALVDTADADRLADEPMVAGILPGATADTVFLRMNNEAMADRTAAVALLQYTSGSTSDPKGVVLTHANILANVELIHVRCRSSAATRMCAWLPLYHDMGLVGTVLHTVYVGASAVLFPSSLFLKRPYRWLQLISAERANATVAPNFGYQTCIDSIDDRRLDGCDLSGLRIALNGAETVMATTMTGFANRFAAHGLPSSAMRACYGMAEATLLVTCADEHDPPRITAAVPADLQRGRLTPALPGDAAQELVSCGPIAGHDVLIVDPRDQGKLLPGAVGEVWIRGASVASGYWRATADDAARFDAATVDGERGFLRTGDLGVVHDGELHVVGRVKDVLVVRGRNLHPHDLEREVKLAHEALRDALAVVFSAPGQQDAIVAVAELRGWSRFDADEMTRIAESVRREITRQYEVRVAGVALVRPGQVPRTSSGKVQHGRAGVLYAEGQMETLYEIADPRLSRLRERNTHETRLNAG